MKLDDIIKTKTGIERRKLKGQEIAKLKSIRKEKAKNQKKKKPLFKR